MHASRKHRVISIFAVSILFQCTSSAPQRFDDRSLNPSRQRAEENTKTTNIAGEPYETKPDYYNYQDNDFWSDNWFAVNTLPTQEGFWSPPEISESLTPPVYAESQFNPVLSEPESQPLTDETSQLERGRSDIDPEEDEEEFGGYFYPKPQIPFDLPDFKPLSVAADEQQPAAVATTTGKPETDKTTTEKITTTTIESSTNPSDKV